MPVIESMSSSHAHYTYNLLSHISVARLLRCVGSGWSERRGPTGRSVTCTVGHCAVCTTCVQHHMSGTCVHSLLGWTRAPLHVRATRVHFMTASSEYSLCNE
jgi:hypothetical protein